MRNVMGKIHIMTEVGGKLLCYAKNPVGKTRVFEHHIIKVKHEKQFCKRCLKRYRKRKVVK